MTKIKCLVNWCNNKGKIEGIRYYRLLENRRQSWLQALGRDPSDDLSSSNRICSQHFRKEDILESGKLRDGAVPSLKLKPKVQSCTSLSTRFSDMPASSQQPIGEDLGIISVISDDEEPSTSGFATTTMTTTTTTTTTTMYDVDTSSSIPSHSTSFQEFLQPQRGGDKRPREYAPSSSSDSAGLLGTPKKRRRIIRMAHSYSASPRKMRTALLRSTVKTSALKRKVRIARQRIQRLRNKIKSLGGLVRHLRNKKFINDEASAIIEKSCSGVPAAILKRLFSNTRRNRVSRKTYNYELRSFAKTLSFYSTKAYEYVRNTFKFALPSLSSIRNWLSNVQCLPGFSQTSFNLLVDKVAENSERNGRTICSLMLDEMAIKKQIDFTAGKCWGYIDFGSGVNDDNMDVATEALVLMVVAVNGNWKLPIGYFFIKSLTGATKANILRQALIKLDEVGVTITSVTCDGPLANFTMMNELGAQVHDLNNLRPYFKHPTTNDNIYVILDACHMLKLMRNCWATLQQLIDKDGGVIDFQLIRRLHELQDSEMLRFGNKLRKAHLEWQRQKMKVSLAAQTLSGSVANSLEFLMTKIEYPGFEDCNATIQFIKVMNNCFDLLNSRNPFAKGCHTALKVSNESYWKPILLQTMEYLKGLKTTNGLPLFSTQQKTPIKGFIITIESLLGLYETYVRADGAPLKYLLTYKFSQDHLELFFCSIRARNGWNNDPTAFQFYHTYKRLLVRHDLKNLRGNCTMQDSTHILSQNIVTRKNCQVQNLSLDDIHVIKKYSLDVQDIEINEHDYAISALPKLTLLTQNVVGYIAGFVVRMMKRQIKCDECIWSLQTVASTSSTMDDALMLFDQKNRGGLIKPSDDLLSVLLITEMFLKKILHTAEALPAENNFHPIFCHMLAMKIFGSDKLFSSLDEHVLNCGISEENHKMRVIKSAIFCYTKIRLFHIAKKQTDKIRGDLIRKQLSKIILFSHQ